MSKACELLEQYRGRPTGVVPVNFSLDREAAKFLLEIAPAPKARGRFVSRLIFEHIARQEERKRLHKQLNAVLSGQDGEGDTHG
jgi:hypothetical protein